VSPTWCCECLYVTRWCHPPGAMYMAVLVCWAGTSPSWQQPVGPPGPGILSWSNSPRWGYRTQACWR